MFGGCCVFNGFVVVVYVLIAFVVSLWLYDFSTPHRSHWVCVRLTVLLKAKEPKSFAFPHPHKRIRKDFLSLACKHFTHTATDPSEQMYSPFICIHEQVLHGRQWRLQHRNHYHKSIAQITRATNVSTATVELETLIATVVARSVCVCMCNSQNRSEIVARSSSIEW